MYKIGNSIDIHNLEKTSNLQKLGGLNLDLGYKILAHSDGDIIFHAISESIIGALSKGDLGDYFSDKLDKNKDLDSLIILEHCLKLLKNENYEICNIDLSIICENIILNPYKNQIKENLIKLFKIDSINIKATRFEKESNQIQCNCVILIKKII
ncbi:MAG: 2-C-methyl-D-erythritol 2,4-cyclodiphosphate synthase [Candidatus Ureaplasma intestinipullorum]|uniref:2-C-methyl-D-erythritol 2,4-cyclodiphosphate synthase n=1 Tax=Candidatus Ureaplasma intestinipullorum TaxID=2838770 RepID=A0A9E2KWW3_9BACT|nr:2-C-methyl-D-erythritol 2,4-cyclodiphosphate synthase [Candidatus Ureaplasma intestinipullorum]